MTPTQQTPGSTPTNTGGGRTGTDEVRDAARDIRRDVESDASRLANRAKDTVREGVEGVRDEATRRADLGIERTADEVSRTSHALETAASEFDEGSLQHQLLHRAASGLTELSGALRGRSIGEIAAEIADFGRRNPAAFLGGAALTGFAIARFARASRMQAERERHGSEYGHAGAGTMHQPQQPPTAHTPYGAGGATGGAAAGSSGAIRGTTQGGPSASTGAGPSGGTGSTPGNPTSPPGMRPSTGGGGGTRPADPDTTTKGAPNV